MLKRTLIAVAAVFLVIAPAEARSTVNKSLRVDAGETVTKELSSVNGSVTVGDGAVLEGEASTVNGTLRIGESTVRGEVSTVNGTIKLDGSTVERDLSTVNGRVSLDRGARVAGNLIVQETRGNNNYWSKALKIELRGGSVIEGDVIVEDPDRKVEIRLLDGSSVGGEIKGATVIRE